MAIKLTVLDPYVHPKLTPHTIVPLRFARAVTNVGADSEAPDLDDHGFTPLPFCSAHGPVVGVIGASRTEKGRTIRIKVMRDRISENALLFASVQKPSVAKLVHPKAAEPLNPKDTPATSTSPARPGDCVFLKGVSRRLRETKLSIHYGAPKGPVIAEMGIHVYPPMIINAQIHLVTINGVSPKAEFEHIRDWIEGSWPGSVNNILAQAGLIIKVRDAVAYKSNDAQKPFTSAGTVTYRAIAAETEGLDSHEIHTVLRLDPTPGALNIYFVHWISNEAKGYPSGLGYSRLVARKYPPSGDFPGVQAGVLISVLALSNSFHAAHVIAHEICHALGLGHWNRARFWAARCLMSPSTGHPGDKHFTTGYAANGLVGTLLMTKKVGGLKASGQIDIMRKAWRKASYAPL